MPHMKKHSDIKEIDFNAIADAEKVFDFDLTSGAELSSLMRDRGIHTFQEAAKWVESLPYRRNRDKKSHTAILDEQCGTCSTKHVFLKRLAYENRRPEVRLMLGIFKMDSCNTPAIAPVLKKFKLKYLPEAHNYLRVHGQILDFTGLGMNETDLADSLLTEREISPYQNTAYKNGMHRTYLVRWIRKKRLPYSRLGIWWIREECIEALGQECL